MIMKRREAREIAFCLIFQKDFSKESSCEEIFEDALTYFDNDDIKNEPYIISTFKGVYDNIEDIDTLIADSSSNWDSERISRVSKAILRLATYEIKYVEDIPTKIAVNEAVEIAKKYDDEKAFSFINGVLAKIAVTVGKKDE